MEVTAFKMHNRSYEKTGIRNDRQLSRNDLLWYWFVNIRGIGQISRQHLLDVFGHPSEVFRASEESLACILKPDARKALLSSKDRKSLIKSMSALKETGSRFIHWESPDYPEKLRHIADPPYGLYLRGRLPDPSLPLLAMVGSRKSTEYGRKVAESFAENLARQGVQIISGLAEGIDAASHRGCLKGHGFTLGILGGGIDTIYPRENFNIYMQMYEEGGVLSEWNLGVQNLPGLFPARNRLISALSDGLFVVEAARRSGTFITVDQALEQGKTVFALPGRVTDKNSMGTNQLIRDGAIPVTCLEDILDHLDLAGRVKEKSSSLSSLPDPGYLPVLHRKILDLLDDQEPVEFTDLLQAIDCNMQELIHGLYRLEAEGWIYQPRQNIYLKNVHI